MGFIPVYYSSPSSPVHMAEGMLVHQLSVLIVIANGMRLLRTVRNKPSEPAAELAPI